MSVLLFRLNGVPDDEANDIRELLDYNDLSYYETSAGKWGISTAAIWLIDNNQLQKAQLLIGEYEKERVFRVRKEFEQLKDQGKIDTLFDKFRQNPIQFVFYFSIIVLIAYVSIKPFMTIGK